jgi:type IV pilus assembly protein PilC
MPSYRYKAIDAKGGKRSGKLLAQNDLELEQRLGAMGYELVGYTESKVKGPSRLRTKVARKDMIGFISQLEQLLKAGVPLVDGLGDIRDSTEEGGLRNLLVAIVQDIESGTTFSDALAKHPQHFDEVFVTLTKVGEQSGQLSAVFEDIVENLKWQDELISQTKKLTVYPSIVLVAVLGAFTFIMLYLMPQLLPFLQDMGTELPPATKALIATSDFFGKYWYLVFSMPVVFFFLLKGIAARNSAVRYRIDLLKLKIPLLGSILFKLKLARFANYFSLMYRSGITVLDSLALGEKLVGNVVMAGAIEKAKDQISSGIQISDSFYNVELFPRYVVRMVKVGESTGQMDTALENVRYYYNREAREAIEKLEPALVPVMTVFLAGLLLWIMAAVLGPVYDSMSQIG